MSTQQFLELIVISSSLSLLWSIIQAVTKSKALPPSTFYFVYQWHYYWSSVSHPRLLCPSSSPINCRVLLFYPQLDSVYSSLYSALVGSSSCFTWTDCDTKLSPVSLPVDLSSASLPELSLLIFDLTQFNSVAQSCLSFCDPMDCSTPGLPDHHQLPVFIHTHVHWVSDAIQPSHPLLSPSLPAFNLSQHQGLFKWVSSSHQVANMKKLS